MKPSREELLLVLEEIALTRRDGHIYGPDTQFYFEKSSSAEIIKVLDELIEEGLIQRTQHGGDIFFIFTSPTDLVRNKKCQEN